MKPDQASSSVGRGVGVLLSRTRALSSSMTRWSRSATNSNDPDVAVLPGSAAVPPSPMRTTSWRAKTIYKGGKPRFVSGKADFMALIQSRKLRNVRESKVAELVDREGYLADIDFDNKGLSLDELQIAAVLMLERAAPMAAFADKIGVTSLFEFVESVRAIYKPNPYHDFRHAVDVMQFMNHLLSRDDVIQRVVAAQQGFGTSADEVKFMLLVACVCHDAGHDGTSNLFQRKTNSELFEKYGPESTLERLHSAHAESLLEASEILNVLKMTPNITMDSAQFLTEVRSLIMATDMEKHAALLATFKASPSAQLLNVLIKISDISNVTRNFEEARTWAKRLEAEVKVTNSRLSPVENQPEPAPLAQGVIGFSKMFALPLIDALDEAGLTETSRDLRARVEQNIQEWEKYSADSLNPGL